MLRLRKNNKHKLQNKWKTLALFSLSAVIVFTLVAPGLTLLLPKNVSAAPTDEQRSECTARGGVLRSVPYAGVEAYYCDTSPGALYSSNGKDLHWQIQSYIYYKTLGSCLAGAPLKDGGLGGASEAYLDFQFDDWWNYVFVGTVVSDSLIDSVSALQTDASVSTSHAQSGEWFANTSVSGGLEVANTSAYMRDLVDNILFTGESGVKNSTISCGNTDLINKALAFWGYGSPQEALCAFGFVSENYATGKSKGVQCVTDGTGGAYLRPASILDTFRVAIKTRVYGGQEPDVSSEAIRYYYLRRVFQQSCIRGDADSIQAIGSTQANSYNNQDLVYGIYDVPDSGELSQEKTFYIGKFGHSEKVFVLGVTPTAFREASGALLSCGDIEVLINRYAEVFAAFIKANPWAIPAEGTNSVAPDPPLTTSCIIEGGFGWIICPLLATLGNISDELYGWVESVLLLNPLKMQDFNKTTGIPENTPQYTAWMVIRDIANVLLVIAFLFIIFSQLTSVGIDNYGIKKMLPRIILVAIAINLSYFLMMIAVDVTNIIGSSLHDVITAPDVVIGGPGQGWGEFTGTLMAGGAFALAGAGVLALTGTALSTLLLTALPFLAVAVLSLLAAVATLFLRNALVTVLAILSPVVFAAYLLPNTEEWFKKWRKMFTSMLMLYPMAALLFAGARFVANITAEMGGTWAPIMALFIMAAPLGMLPWLAKSSGGVLATIGGKLQGMAKSAKAPLTKALDPFVQSSRAKYRSGDKNWLGMNRGGDPLTRQRTAGQRFNHGRLRREKDTQAAKDLAESQLGHRALALNPDGSPVDRKTASVFNRARVSGEAKRLVGAAEEATTKNLRNQPGLIGGYQQQFEQHESTGKTAEGVTKARATARVLRGAQAGASVADRRLYDESRLQRLNEGQASRDDTLLKVSHLRAQDEIGIATRAAMSDTEVGSAQVETVESNVKAQAEQENVPTFVELKAAQQAKENASNSTGQIVEEASSGTAEGRAAAEAAGVDGTVIDNLQNLADEKSDVEFSTGVASRAKGRERTERILDGRKAAPTTIGGRAAEVQYRAQAQAEKSRLTSEAVERQLTLEGEAGQFFRGNIDPETGALRTADELFVPGLPTGTDHLRRVDSYGLDPEGSGVEEEQLLASIKFLEEKGGDSDMGRLYFETLPKFNAGGEVYERLRAQKIAEKLAGGATQEEAAEEASREAASDLADIRGAIQTAISRKGGVFIFNGRRVGRALSGNTIPAREAIEYVAEDPNFSAETLANSSLSAETKQRVLTLLENGIPDAVRATLPAEDLATLETKLEDARRRVRETIVEIDRVPEYQARTASWRAQLDRIAAVPPGGQPPEQPPGQPPEQPTPNNYLG